MKKILCCIVLSVSLFFSHKSMGCQKITLPNPPRKKKSEMMVMQYMQHTPIVDENRPQIKALNATIKQFNESIKNDPTIKQFYNDPQNCLAYIRGLSSLYNCQHDYIAKKLNLEAAQRRNEFQQIAFDKSDYDLGERVYDPEFDLGYTMDWCFANLPEFVLAMSGSPEYFGKLLKNPSFDMYENFAYETPPCMLAMYLLTDLPILKEIINHRNFNPNFQCKGTGNTPILLTMVDEVLPDVIDPICETIKMLVAKGADPRLANNQGLTPLRRARETKFSKIIETIEEILNKNVS